MGDCVEEEKNITEKTRSEKQNKEKRKTNADVKRKKCSTSQEEMRRRTVLSQKIERPEAPYFST